MDVLWTIALPIIFSIAILCAIVVVIRRIRRGEKAGQLGLILALVLIGVVYSLGKEAWEAYTNPKEYLQRIDLTN